jgi:hypothetical protein
MIVQENEGLKVLIEATKGRRAVTKARGSQVGRQQCRSEAQRENRA